ncbi:MAG: hypothetical protein AAF512_01290 [Pseudomonadota bacterium]
MSYQLIFRGELLPDYSQAAVLPELARLLRTEESLLANLFDGQPWLIREAKDEADAQRYVAAFQQAGAVCHIQAPTISTEQHEADSESVSWQLDSYPLAPKLVSRPKHHPVHTEPQPVALVTAKYPLFGRLAILLAAAMLAMQLQQTLTPWLVQNWGTGLVIIVSSAVLYFATIYLGVAVGNMRYLSIQTNRNDDVPLLSIQATPAWRPWLSSYRLLKTNDELVGYIQYKRSTRELQLLDSDRALQYLVQTEVNAQDASLEAGFELQSQLLTLPGFDYLRNWVMRGRNPPDWRIRDAEQRLIATFSPGKRCELKLSQSLNDEQKQQLIALFIVMAGF